MYKSYPLLTVLTLILISQIRLNGQCAFDASAGPDIYVCEQLPVQAQLNGEVYGAYGDITQTLWHKGPQWIAKNNNTPTVLINQPAQYIFTAEGAGTENLIFNGDFEMGNTGFNTEYTFVATHLATGCTSEVTVAVVENFTSPAINIQAPDTLGNGLDTLSLSATVTPANSMVQWSTPDGNIVSGANTLTPLINSGGTYILTVTNPANGCTGTSSVEVVQLNACPLDVYAGEDIHLFNCGQPAEIQLNGQVNGPYYDYHWESIPQTPNNGLSDPTSLNPTVTVSSNATYVLKARAFSTDNLIVNGDFEQGNVGFTTDFTYSPGDLTNQGTYDILPNPQAANPIFPPCGDHTTGSGNMMALVPVEPLQYAWCQTVPVDPFTEYEFSCWGTRLEGTERTIFIFFHTSPLIIGSFKPQAGCEWTNYTVKFNSGVLSSLHICIHAPKVHPNDYFAFALDDIYMNSYCEVSDTVSIITHPVVAVASPTNYLLPCDSQLTLNGEGSSVGPEVTYQWDTDNGNIVSGGNTLHPVVDAPGNYTLTVIATNYGVECTKTAEVTVTQPTVSVAINAPETLKCDPANALLQGSSNYQPGVATYQWTAGPGGNFTTGTNGLIAIVDQPGEYTLLVTHVLSGCTGEATVSIDSAIVPEVSVDANMLNCISSESILSGEGSSTGPGIVYAWTTPDGEILSGQDSLFALTDTVGTYVLLVTNTANACTATDTVLVTQDTLSPVPVLLPVDTITCALNEVTLLTDSLAYTGPQLIFDWIVPPGGNIVSGEDSLAPIVNAPGWYTLQVTDTLSGCIGLDSVLVEADTMALVAIANAPEPLTCTALEVVLNADGSSSDPSIVYQWTTDNGNIVSGANTPTPTVDAPGIYQLQLTDASTGCTASDIAVVVQSSAPPEVTVQTPELLTCLLTQEMLLAANADTSGQFQYQWTASSGGNIVSGATSLTPVVDAAGTYILQTTNIANGCTSQTSVQLNADQENPEVALEVSGNLNCHNSTVLLSSTSPVDPDLLNHSWTNPDGTTGESGTDPSWTADSPGAYALLLTNTQNGCTSTATLSVVEHGPVTAEVATQTDVSCFGAEDGSLSVLAAGGDGQFSFAWNTGETTSSLSNLIAGNYSLTVTDGEDCTATLVLEITEPEVLLANVIAVEVSVPGGNDGSAQANPTGGTAPFTYNWSTGAQTQMINGLGGGLYTVTVTDALGCTTVETVEIFDGVCMLSGNIAATDPACFGETSGTATAVPLGGSAPFNFLWSSGETDQTAENLAAGTYTVTVTDVHDCTFTASVSINEPPALGLVSVEVIPTSCAGNSEGSATVEASGGTGNLSISWSDGQQGAEATNLSAGMYTAVVTDANGCTASLEITIESNDNEPPVLAANPAPLPVGPAGSVTLTVMNLGLTVSDNCGVQEVVFEPESFNCLQLGTQQVTVIATDESGNTSMLTFDVNVVDQTAPTVTCPVDIQRCAEDAIVEYTAPVATDNCLALGGQFDLIEGLPSGEQFPEGTTVTTYTYTDFSGNVGQCSFEVTILSPLEITIDTIVHTISGQSMGSIQVTVSNNNPGYTYAWMANGEIIADTEDLFGVPAGEYTLLVTDANGCSQQSAPIVVDELVNSTNPRLRELIELFPNPTTGKVFVVLSEALGNSEVQVLTFDARGRTVQEQFLEKQKQIELDWSAFADGLYTIQLRTQFGQFVYRVALKR